MWGWNADVIRDALILFGVLAFITGAAVFGGILLLIHLAR